MSFAGLVLAVVAGVPQWVEEPRITQAQAGTGENFLMFDLGKSLAHGRLNVQVREMDGRFVFGETIPVHDGTAGLGFRPGSVGPWLVTLNLVGDSGRLSPDRRLAIDVDWVPLCEGESPWHPCRRVFTCGNDSGDARVLILGGNPRSNDPLWLRVRRAPSNLVQLVTAEPLEASGSPLRLADDEDDGAGTHYLLFVPRHPLPILQPLHIAHGMHTPEVLQHIAGQGGLILKESEPPPEWRGEIETRSGPGASLQLNFHDEGGYLARIHLEYPGLPGRSRSIMTERDEGVFRVGCVACRNGLELPEDTDVVLTVQLVNAAQESAPRRILVRTPLHTDGRNGRRPSAWETANLIPDPPRVELAPPPPPPPPPPLWPLRVLLFGALPFLVGYALQTLRRKMSSPSSPCTARRKPKSRNSAIG